MTELPIWAIEPSVPSAHVVAAAVRVARMLDRQGSELTDLRRSYRQHASGAYYAEPDMIKGEALLIDCDLARLVGTRVMPAPELFGLAIDDDAEAAIQITTHVLAQLPLSTDPKYLASLVDAAIQDAERREELLVALGSKYDDALARLVGEIGEEIVLHAVRDELLQLGYPSLARDAHRVSLQSDALGYDVSAPRIGGSRRLLEVKASTSPGEIEFFLSRNEAEVGRCYPDDWFLVYVRVQSIEQRTGEIIGWCERGSLDAHLPLDHGSGTWTSVRIASSADLLKTGIPA